MRVLIADDEPDLRETLKLLLETRGHTVVCAKDGRDAVDTAIQTRPDVIVMDVRMPVMDGITATRLLRTRPEMQSVPVICTSGYLEGEYSVRQALAAGCVECLPKPMEWKKLEQLLERLVVDPAGQASG
jgi:CheY-like chemotaxis protein